MIAIPNMSKPKNCKVCPFTCEKLAFFDGKNRPQGCPLIDIVRCGECKHRPIKDDSDGEDYGFNIVEPTDGDDLCPCLVEDGWYSWMPEDNFYCGRGERRSDEDTVQD